jgi:hypothetical protein
MPAAGAAPPGACHPGDCGCNARQCSTAARGACSAPFINPALPLGVPAAAGLACDTILALRWRGWRRNGSGRWWLAGVASARRLASPAAAPSLAWAATAQLEGPSPSHNRAACHRILGPAPHASTLSMQRPPALAPAPRLQVVRAGKVDGGPKIAIVGVTGEQLSRMGAWGMLSGYSLAVVHCCASLAAPLWTPAGPHSTLPPHPPPATCRLPPAL